jgi:cobalt/nickel transport system permease protein
VTSVSEAHTPPPSRAAAHYAPLPVPAPDPRAREDFIGRTLGSLGTKTRKAMAAEKSATLPGWLQRTDARAKVVGGLALILTASLVRSHWVLAVLYLVTLVAAVSSLVALRTTLRRVWLAVPLFSGLVLLPAILNIVTPGTTLVVLWVLPPGAHIGPIALPAAITITQQGVAGASLALLRVLVSVGVTTTLIATTRWQELLAALRWLKVPTTFVMIIEMAYRYFFVLAGIARDDFLARRSRTIVATSGAEGRQFVAGRATGLLRRSLSMAEKVNAAMVSRGWTGSPRVLGARALSTGDIAFMSGTLALAVVTLVAGLR